MSAGLSRPSGEPGEPWDQVDLVLLPLPEDPVPVDLAAVAEHLASRRVGAAVLEGERIGVVGAVVARFAVRGPVVAAFDPDGSVHRGPHLAEVALGLAYRVGAVVHVDDELVLDSSGRLLDDERVLAGVEVSARSRTVTAWRADDLLLARMTAAELGWHGDAVLAGGWVVVAWDDAEAVPDEPLPLPAAQHPVAQARRTGDLRSVLVTPHRDAAPLEVTWAPRLTPVLEAPDGSPAAAVLADLVVTVASQDPDHWPDSVDRVLLPHLLDAQRGDGEAFLTTVSRVLWLPPALAELVEAPEGHVVPGATRIGGGTARGLAWEHVRTPGPESEAERRLRAMPRRAVVRHVVLMSVLAVVLATLALTLDLLFAGWVLGAMAAYAAFDAVSTVWFRRSPRSADK